MGNATRKGRAEGDDGASAGTPVKKACLEDFVLLKTVGKGSFGKVVQVNSAVDPCGVWRAV